MAHRNPLVVPILALLAVACGTPSPETESPPEAAPAETETVAVAFTLAERDLLPESIAYDPVEGTFYVGSTRHGKIVKVAADGTVGDFVEPRAEGLWMVMGMKVDAERRHLWVASSDGDNLAGYRQARDRAAGVFQFDLDSGALIAKWLLAAPGATSFLNDLVVTPEGSVYVTNMFNRPLVYVIDAAKGELEVFARPGGFRAPNGIAQGNDGALYVAHREGLSVFDPATAQRTAVTLPAGSAFTPIDGLYAHRGSLIGVHPEEGMIRRFSLDSAGRAVTAIEILVEDHPAISGLTTGVVIDGSLLFVANSQFDRLTDGRLPGDAELEDYVVLRLALD